MAATSPDGDATGSSAGSEKSLLQSVQGPVQIITVSAEGTGFQLEERRLRFVLQKV